MEPFPVVIFCALLVLLASPLPGRPAAKLLNDTLSPDTYGQVRPLPPIELPKGYYHVGRLMSMWFLLASLSPPLCYTGIQH